ncbi:MAG: hypothetical protein AAFN77_18725 [Planctomycetota bacterium]
MKELVGEFQQAQIQFTMKNGDRQQKLNRLIKENKVAEATVLADEMFSDFDVSMLSLNRKVESTILPHQLKRLNQIAKQKSRMSRTPFRDEFGIALAIVTELDLPNTASEKTSEKSQQYAANYLIELKSYERKQETKWYNHFH